MVQRREEPVVLVRGDAIIAYPASVTAPITPTMTPVRVDLVNRLRPLVDCSAMIEVAFVMVCSDDFLSVMR